MICLINYHITIKLDTVCRKRVFFLNSQMKKKTLNKNNNLKSTLRNLSLLCTQETQTHSHNSTYEYIFKKRSIKKKMVIKYTKY